MKSIIAFAVLACIVIVNATTPAPTGQDDKVVQREFLTYMHKYKRTYNSTEFKVRFENFKTNWNFIQKHNADRTKTHTVAVNVLADLSKAEYLALLGTKVDLAKHAAGPKFNEQPVAAPATWDWRTKKVVTPVKNQGQCGSCWSFSTTGSTEACHAIKYGPSKLVSLSEQNLIDCSVSYGNQGCSGGLMTDAFDYIIANGGLDTEKSYPYTTSGPNTCEYDPSNLPNPVASVVSYANVPSGDESSLQQAGTHGPVSVAIDAGESSFQFYSSGVYYEPDCSSTQLDHGVLMVGWGTENSADFWWVKNSWGTSWGLDGYIKMARNRQNNCGIATMATLPKC